MSSRVILTGFEEFKTALRQLPQELAGEARGIVNGAADAAASDIRAAYPEVTGNLRRGVKVTHAGSGLGVVSVLKSTARHSHLYEFGSQTRHTASGAHRGRMPSRPTFIPVVMRKRKAMFQALVALVRRAGFQVNDAGFV